jgi:hypothetical protein
LISHFAISLLNSHILVSRLFLRHWWTAFISSPH